MILRFFSLDFWSWGFGLGFTLHFGSFWGVVSLGGFVFLRFSSHLSLVCFLLSFEGFFDDFFLALCPVCWFSA